MTDAPYDIRMDEAITLLPRETCTAFLACNSAIDQRLLAAPYNLIRTEREATTCTANFLPFLAWERSVHHWTGTDEAIDRARTDTSFEDHAGYGSPDAQEAEMRLDLGYDDITIREYWQVRGGHWPDFQVRIGVASGGPPPPAYADVRRWAIKRKNVRDWPDEYSYEVEESGPFGIAARQVLNGVINSLPLDPTPQSIGTSFVGARGSLTGTIHSRPL